MIVVLGKYRQTERIGCAHKLNNPVFLLLQDAIGHTSAGSDHLKGRSIIATKAGDLYRLQNDCAILLTWNAYNHRQHYEKVGREKGLHLLCIDVFATQLRHPTV
jgi:hypothetical protein